MKGVADGASSSSKLLVASVVISVVSYLHIYRVNMTVLMRGEHIRWATSIHKDEFEGGY